jgi:lauroyl/myristoyl acyltransferase
MKKYLISFKTGFQKFSHLIADLVNLILLAVVYFIGIGITSMVAKITGKHFLKLKKKDVNSYWIDCQPAGKELDDYYRQF